jgi:uncharacterized protein YggU (UPF0235/DUF167 family)
VIARDRRERTRSVFGSRAANAALVEFFSELFRVPRHDVRISAGETSRSKVVEIDGIAARVVQDLADGGVR